MSQSFFLLTTLSKVFSLASVPSVQWSGTDTRQSQTWHTHNCIESSRIISSNRCWTLESLCRLIIARKKWLEVWEIKWCCAPFMSSWWELWDFAFSLSYTVNTARGAFVGLTSADGTFRNDRIGSKTAPGWLMRINEIGPCFSSSESLA